MHTRTRLLRAGFVAFGLTALLAMPASAHPSFSQNLVPAGEQVVLDLVVPHGCTASGGMPSSDEEAFATNEFAVQIPVGVGDVRPLEVPGWSLMISEDENGRVEDFVWSDDGGATTEPITFQVEARFAGDPGTELYLSAFQACEDGQPFRWIGTPTEEAEYPAIRVVLSEGELGQAPSADRSGMDDEGMSDHDESDAGMDHSDGEMSGDMADDASDSDGATHDGDGESAPATGDGHGDDAVVAAQSSSSSATAIGAILVGAVFLLVGILAGRSAFRSSTSES